MSTIHEATCRSCGYNTSVTTGVGFSDADGKRYLWPFSCEKCNELVTANLLSSAPRCPQCRTRKIRPLTGAVVGTPPLLETDETEDPLLAHPHLCPKCGNKTLTLEVYGMAD